jgi:hypothetical protein
MNKRCDVTFMNWPTFRNIVLGDRPRLLELMKPFDLVYGGADLTLDLK